MDPKSRLLRLLVGLIVPAGVFALWLVLFWWKGKQTNYAVGPHQALLALKNDWENIYPNALASLWRLVLGVLIGTSLGTVSGISLARLRWARRMFSPTLQVISAIPFMVWIPFLLMAFGLGELFRLSVVALCTFLLVHGHCCHAVAQLNPDFIELSRVYEKAPWQILLQVVIPAAMPAILNATRGSFVLGWIAVALAEKAVAAIPGGGLGFYILRAKEFGQPDTMFAGVIVLAVLALVIDLVLAQTQKCAGSA